MIKPMDNSVFWRAILERARARHAQARAIGYSAGFPQYVRNEYDRAFARAMGIDDELPVQWSNAGTRRLPQ